MSVFTIIVEQMPIDGDVAATALEGTYYLTRQEARDALLWIAATNYNYEIDLGSDSFEVPTAPAGLDYELYYIEELVRG